MQRTGCRTDQQRARPRQRQDTCGERHPYEEDDRGRKREEQSQEHGRPAAAQVGVDPEPDPDARHAAILCLAQHERCYGAAVRRALLLLLVLVLAACGKTVGNRLSKGEYASRADAVCKIYTEQTNKLARPQTLKGLGELAAKSLPLLDKAVSDLQRLESPQSEQALTTRWLDQLKLLRDDITKIRDGAKANDGAAVQAVVPAARQHNDRFNALATQLGMKVCNSDTGTG